jgi:hypothetical protein
MIKQTFFHLFISLLLCANHGCALANAVDSDLSSMASPELAPTAWKQDALSAYHSALYLMRQENTGVLELIGIQGRWIDENLWGEWEYTFAADHKQWTYDGQGLRLKQDLKKTDRVSTAVVAPPMANLLSELSAQLETHPPLLLEKHLAGVNWTQTSGWVYNLPLESTLQ